MTRFLTNSELRLYQRCKRRWWLSHYRGLYKIGEHDFNKPFGIGNRLHSALEVYYTPDDPQDPLEFMRASIEADLRDAPEELHDAITKEGELCLIMLEGYLDWLAETGADQAFEVIEAEKPRMARLEKGRDVFLLAKLDARVRHEEFGSRISLDHKTVQSLSQMLPDLRLNTQALTQTLIERLLDAEEGREPLPTGTLFNFMRKVKRTVTAKPPFYAREFVNHTDSELRNHWKHLIQLADEIETTEGLLAQGPDEHQYVVPPNPTRDCSWDCPFFQLCPMLDNDADRHEDYIAAKYAVGDPLARYAGQIGARDLIS